MIDFNELAYGYLDPSKNAADFKMWNVVQGKSPNGGNFLHFEESGVLGGIHLARVATAGLANFTTRRGQLGKIWVDVLDANIPRVAEVCLGLQYAGMGLSKSKQYILGSGPERRGTRHPRDEADREDSRDRRPARGSPPASW